MSSALDYRFPDGKSKALIMSYDDGSEHDRRLVELFNRYCIRASFHLNSGKLGQPYYISPSEVYSLYQGHEVSCHTVNHPDLTKLDEDGIRREISQDQQRLEDLTGAAVRGMAYPFGAYNDSIVALLPELGIQYARTVITTQSFAISQDFLVWETTCHHSQAMEMGKRFLESQSQALQLLYIWGHSYELAGFMTADPSKDWRYMEAVCQLLQDRDEIYYTTTIELVDYLNALKKIELLSSETFISNASDRSVWVSWKDSMMALAPGETRSL